MIHVVATVELHPGTREKYLAEFAQVVPHVRAETGCIEYGAAVDVASSLRAQPPLRPDVVTIVERWSDVPALDAHSVAPHMLAYRERIKSLVLRATVHVLAPVAEG
jgi:quinol monooxygenase YgiN